MFRAGGKEASVECVHVEVYAGSLESAPSDAELAQSSELRPVSLAPEEYFFALNSYVAGIAEVGLAAMFALARQAGNLPVGFNALMQEQVLSALSEVVPAAALDRCLWFLEDATPGRGNLGKSVRAIVVWSEHTPLEVRMRLVKDPDNGVRRSLASSEHTPPEVRARFTGDTDLFVREGVAWNKHTPPQILASLAGDANIDIRRDVAWNERAPYVTLVRIAPDEYEKHRVQQSACDTLSRLKGDPLHSN